MSEESLMQRPLYQGKQQAEAYVEEEFKSAFVVDQQAQEAPSEDELEAKTPVDENWKSRYGHLRSHAEKQKQKLEKEIEQLKSMLATAPSAPEESEKLQQFKNEHPDDYDLLKQVAESQTADMQKTVAELRKELEETREENARDKQIVILAERHSDWQKYGEDGEFHAWLSTKSERWQDAFYAEPLDGAYAADVLDVYKEHIGQNSKRDSVRDAQREASMDVLSNRGPTPSDEPKDPNQGKRVWKTSEIANLKPGEVTNPDGSDSDLWLDVMAAQAEGRIVDDTSKASAATRMR